MRNHQRELRRKSIVFALIAIVTNVGGNALLARGMHQTGQPLSLLDYLHVLANPFVDAGIAMLAAWLLANLSLLSWADLSYVLPITATGYAFAAILGWAALGEHVSTSHWIGVTLITIGAALVGKTPPHTTP
ncbi:MAG: EamA family transporter [Acidobacteriia bacterium]|nr:EamA family transporter [Terriglobia bacterium]